MTRLRLRSAVSIVPLLALVLSTTVNAQEYFGRNKVQYESFKWQILKSEHFDNFFYPPESTIVRDAGRQPARLGDAGARTAQSEAAPGCIRRTSS